MEKVETTPVLYTSKSLGCSYQIDRPGLHETKCDVSAKLLTMLTTILLANLVGDGPQDRQNEDVSSNISDPHKRHFTVIAQLSATHAKCKL